MSQLLPEGIDHLGDCPFTLHDAIKSGLRILSYEEYPVDERPPRDSWFDQEKLAAHWERVEEERKAGYSAGRTDDDEPLDDSNSELNAVELIKRG